jgi:hypothetical protein
MGSMEGKAETRCLTESGNHTCTRPWQIKPRPPRHGLSPLEPSNPGILPLSEFPREKSPFFVVRFCGVLGARQTLLNRGRELLDREACRSPRRNS